MNYNDTDYLEGQFAKCREKLKAKFGTRNIFKLLQYLYVRRESPKNCRFHYSVLYHNFAALCRPISLRIGCLK